MHKKLLVIDDEPGHRLMIRAVMEDEGWQVFEAGSGEEGLATFSANPDIAVALVDMKMPGMDGKQTLLSLHAQEPNLPVILLTAYGTVGSAVEAMKQGAFDYLTKPADNDELVITLNRAWEYQSLLRENGQLKSKIAGEKALQSIVGTSRAIKKIHDLIQQVGPSEATVLITGESGTGKELIAEALHATSSRAQKDLIKVNCAALPGQLLESELFGFKKGAFTGAVKDKPGRFQLADGGTLFLDEIGEIPLDLQAKLLRAIQEKIIEPLGSVASVAVDVRIIAATNKDLRKEVAKGNFREDLFFRLNVLEIHSPPLRERFEDIPLLVGHLLGILSKKNKKNIRGVSPAFLAELTKYSWQGNVRELENVLERALILSRSDSIGVDVLPSVGYGVDKEHRIIDISSSIKENASSFLTPAESIGRNSLEENVKKTLILPSEPDFYSTYEGVHELSPFEEAEKKAIIQALKENKGHREKTAEVLGISRRTLQYKLKKLGLKRRQ